MCEDPKTKVAKRQGWEIRVERPYEIFVVPLCFFNREANSFHFGEVIVRKIDDEANAKVVQPWMTLSGRLQTVLDRSTKQISTSELTVF
jgi:hypothetical protein